MNTNATSEPVARRRFLFVRSASETYALPLTRVKRVLRSCKTYPVPGSRDAFLGLLQHEGEPVIALDLAALVEPGRASGGDLPFAIIVRAGASGQRERVALAVDDALTIVSISETAISLVHDGLIEGETVIEGQVVRILDLSAIGAEG